MKTNELKEKWTLLLMKIHLETNVSRLQDECFSLRMMHNELTKRGIPEKWFYEQEDRMDLSQ